VKKLPQETIQEVISLYQSGVPPKEIGEKLGVYNNSVTRLLRKHGVERTQAAPRVSPEQTQYIIQKYQDGVSSEILAKELSIHSTTVLRILKRNNIDIRSDSESKRKYPLDESILDHIDSEIKAYFLGLLWSDGNISKKGNDISIRLISKDKEILQQLSMFFYGQDRIMIATDGNNREIATFRMSSQKLKQRLGELGCHPNKTFTNKYPVGLDPSLDRHFIRGVIDGDGSVLDYDYPVITITGTDELLCEISEKIEKELNFKPYKSKKLEYRKNDKNILHLEYHGFKKFKALGEWIYNESIIKIHRKYDNYLRALTRVPNVRFTAEEESIIIKKFKEGKSFGEISRESNEHYSNIKKIIKRNAPSEYGSINPIVYEGEKLTKDYIDSLDSLKKQEIKEYLFHYFKGFGFPYPKFSDLELLNDWKAIKEFDSSTIIDGNLIKTRNYTGNKLSKHFFENFYKVSSENKISMIDAFNNDDLLNKVLDNRLGISYKETFNISGAMLRQGLKNSKVASGASIFLTSVAKYLYDTYAEENGIVYDYSCGFGQRLIGAMASKKNLTYVGVEPWTESFSNLEKLYKFLFKQEKCNIYNVGSENFYDENLKEKVCLAFSSPPYFDTEVYSDESTQCNLGSYQDYLSYWDKTCQNIFKMLKSNGYFIVNISEKYKHDLTEIASNYFNYEKDLYLNYFTAKADTMKNEPIIVMRKK
jgi:tRNA1(Val) A37 N6-methylase TrmN6